MPASEKTHSEKTAAEKKSIGFDHQYYFFLWKLLSLTPGESVGFEVKDDVHTDLNADKQVLYQVKHTVLNKADGAPKNLTTYDLDLWKTLSNWSKVITDKNDGREKVGGQKKFIEKTDFILASNKSTSIDNELMNLVIELKDLNHKPSDLVLSLRKIKASTKDSIITGYISDVLLLRQKVLLSFFEKISFELDEDDILNKCKESIRSDKVSENKIDDVFRRIDSDVRADNYLRVKRGEKIEITFNEFYRKYQRNYDVYRNNNLPIRDFDAAFSGKLENQTFIIQILELEDIDLTDIEQMAEYTRMRLKLKNNIDEWLQNGEITREEVREFNSESKLRWNNEFNSVNRGSVKTKKYNVKGLKVLDKVRGCKLSIADQELSIEMSNGEYYELSDIPIIGWRKDWVKYK